MIVDIPYCASSYLIHRTIIDRNRCFSEKLAPRLYSRSGEPEPIHDSTELYNSLKRQVEEACVDGKAALALSGGIDSALLARFMPKGSVAYTFKCVVPGMEVVDETPQAAKYAAECGLQHEVIEVTWDDMEELAPQLMRHKGAPIHSIEVQIAKGATKAYEDGFEKLIFGESADINYGGLSGLLSQSWTFGQYVQRFSYVLPYAVLKDYRLVLDPFINACDVCGNVDVFKHLRETEFIASMGSYTNATEWGGVAFVAPYANTWLAEPLNYERIRSGEDKYIIREAFAHAYPGWEAPAKTPMPRPMEEWLADWEGPVRGEFWPNCTQGMTGDQKWLVWALERFLNLLD